MMFVDTIERAAALFLVIASIQVHLALSELVVLSGCVCPGRELRLECTVVGGLATVWRGTAFDCPGSGDEILLSHPRFESEGAAGQCNNGIIIAQNHNVIFNGTNSTFISQLIINLPSMNAINNIPEGQTVECFHSRPASNILIGTHMITYIRDAPTPDNVHLAQVSRNELNFQWEPVCSDVEYKVNATNCGMCPQDTTFNASVTCVVGDIALLTSTSNTSGTMCTLSVETAVCGFQSNSSEAATALLKAPGHPNISKVLPYYNSSSSQLIRIDIQVKLDEERFYISEGIDGSITSYTFDISFSDSESNCTSPTTVVPVSSCVAGVCNITLANLTSLPCYKHPSQAEVAVYASNVLTDGPPSMTPLLNTSNSLFIVEYKQLSNIFSCLFVGSYENKSCDITYGAVDPTDQTCAIDTRHIMNSSNDQMSDTVIVFIPSLAQAKPAVYCFNAIGKTPTFTIAVEGTFTIDTSTSGITNTTVILIAIISVISCAIIILLLGFIAVLTRIILKKKRTLKQREYTDQDEQQYDRTTFAQRQLRQVPSTHSEQTDEQQYNQIAHQQHRNSKAPSTHPDQAEEQQYDQIFIQKQSKQPIAIQQMVYSELGPTVTGKKTSNFVLGSDDRIEYAELDHKLHGHAPTPPLDTVRTVTTCLTTPPEAECNFDVREESPPPPPLPPKYTMM